ncbi:MAG: hypothetical protein RLZZ387_2951 [Chloroflexota bacterium]|jgi:hypothetical protein
MISMHDMDPQARLAHAARLAEAEEHRLAELTAKPERSRAPTSTRARAAQALIAWGHWLDGRDELRPRYDAEQEGAY